MKKRVAVENGLSGVKEFLEEHGYEVVGPEEMHRAGVFVTTGMDRNLMNNQDVVTGAVIVDASGRTPDEILERIKSVYD